MKRKNIIPYEPLGLIMEMHGAQRVSHEAKVVMSEHLEEFSMKLGQLAVRYAKHAGRTTVTDKDLELAAKNLR